MRTLRLGIAQINATVGDLAGNSARILDYIARAKELGIDLVSFPELAITGYPPEDLLLKPQFIADNLKWLDNIVQGCRGIAAVVGFVDAKDDLYNAAAFIHDGKLAGIYHKNYLPNYGVFDEDRYFRHGTECPIFVLQGIGIGINICEDIWYPTGPVTSQTHAGAEVIVNINSSPYYAGKTKFREKMLATRASDAGVIVSYTNLVGGQDELVFDGNSLVLNEKGEIIAQGKAFEEDLIAVDLDVEGIFRTRLHDPRRRKERIAHETQAPACKVMVSETSPTRPKPSLPPHSPPPFDPIGEIYSALVVGTRDYVRKNGFQKVAIGLSGGVDSSLVAVIAVDALGPDNVIVVAMPSRYSSPGSISDAELLAKNLNISLLNIPIEDAFQSYLRMLSESFKGTEPGTAEENIQARIRGNLLMALSNKFGWIVLTTGNKSEYATGYTTLYGDMAGGFAVIKDVPKTLVYQLAQFKNAQAGKKIMPDSVLEKEPSAELRPNQKDTDNLPPYEVLDTVLHAYVEEDKSFPQILAMGFDEATVKKVIKMVDSNEYKRRQSPPGVKITPRAFGRDRRLPITNKYRSF